MNKIFWDNPYLAELSTTISSVNGNEVLFADTIVYSFSGGQESDKAYVNQLEIISSRMDGSLIYYTLPEGHKLKSGDQVIMRIDWPRRLKLMRLHFAAELILELVTKKLNLEKVGAHISETKSRIDFIWDNNISTIFDDLLREYNHIIDSNLPIQKDYLDKNSQRRYWQIDGFSKVPCGGTHLNSTAEVGYITLKRSHPGKSIERIEIRLRD